MFAVDGSWGEPSQDVVATQGSAVAAQDDADIEMLLDKVDLLGVIPRLPKMAAAKTVSEPSGADIWCAPAAEGVELGYVSPWLAEWGSPRPEQFPSKVGGVPVWLEPEHLPSAESLRCGVCGKSMRYLLQLYCPRWPELQHAYHRSLMLFCCGGACLLESAGWKALRCNLEQDTRYYVIEDGAFTCPVASETTRTGSREGANALVSPKLVTPELSLSISLEGDWAATLAWWESETNSKAHAERLLQQYRQGQAGQTGTEGSVDAARTKRSEDQTLTLDQRVALATCEVGSSTASEGEDGEDVEDGFYGFQRRVGANPEQVLRYCHKANSAPLWLSAAGRPKSIPPCSRCGAARWFEFQVLPQLLLSLEQNEDPTVTDSLDWGTVAVYSCSASCAAPNGSASVYAEEFVWHQQV